jgi:methionyl-tRNA synthetase
MVLTHKYYEGKVPAAGNLNEMDQATLNTMIAFPEKLENAIEKYHFREYSQQLMNLARLGNKYLAEQEPWKLIKEDPERVKTIMNTALQIAASLAILSEPLLPFTSDKMKKMFNFSNSWNEVSGNILTESHQLNSAELLFDKIEDAEIEKQLEKLKANKMEESSKNVKAKENISFDDFSKLDLRTGTIITADKMAKTKKLLVLKVALENEEKTIVSGIAESYNAEDVIGKKVTVLTNLEPRKIRGIESQGMLLMGEDKDGRLMFVSPEDPDAANGLPIS